MATDAYERITARILAELDAGTVPWHRPWQGGEAGHPRNLVSGHRYRGVNVFLLACSPFDSPHWLTFRQARSLGGSVRRGEKATPVVFWRWLDREDAETGTAVRFPLLRTYSVFNTEQCDLPVGKLPEPSTVSECDFEPLAECERVVEWMPQPPTIRHGGGVAGYGPATDVVQMPRPERFESGATYYATLFHELTHATGHSARLNRVSVVDAKPFGSSEYSREELVAEMGAAFLCGHTGIENETIEQSAAYIDGWLSALRSDKRLVVQAAGAAQKAADFILGRLSDETDPDGESVGGDRALAAPARTGDSR